MSPGLQRIAGDDSAQRKAELLADLEEAIAEHKALWLARNRPGGLELSLKRFDGLLAAYRGLGRFRLGEGANKTVRPTTESAWLCAGSRGVRRNAVPGPIGDTSVMLLARSRRRFSLSYAIGVTS